MKSLAMILLASVLMLAPGTGATQADETPRTLSVTGSATVDTAPDMATISLVVLTEAETARDALSDNTSRMSAVFQSLSQFEIAERDKQTSGLRLEPVWENRREYTDGRPKILGYRAHNTLAIRVRDLDTLGTVLDTVVTDGATGFQGLQFGVADPKPFQDEARRRAMADALERAQLFAEAAGVALGDVLSISESGGPIRPEMMRMEMADAASGVPVAAGEIGLSARVSLVIGLE